MKVPAAVTRTLTRGEEIANSVTHGVGLLASVVAFPFLVMTAAQRWGAPEVIGAAVFAATLVALYLVSTLYHALRPSRAKQVLQKLDHAAIYLLIAGSYTPFTLGVLRGTWGWTLLSLVWAIAGTGIALEFALGKKVHKVAVALYVVMGWLVVVAVKPLLAAVPWPGLAWLVAGGLLYTGGVAFYAAKRVRYAHAVWHLFVLAGSACHFVAIWGWSGRA
ncbi:MAG TPA: hemolysin III family protein [Thermoanaerobaculia bacterium]|nr:hemolysin III family protein [Thermoanaerobaculia bacterium]